MVRSPRRLTAAAVLLATALAGIPALLSSADAASDRDDRAVARAADRYDVSESALRDRLRRDPRFHVTPGGAAYITYPASATESVHVIGQAFPLDQTFLLHSKPGSPRTIYLDFNGHSVSGTWWNDPAVTNVPAGAHPAWDPDGNGAAFTDSEKLKVQDVFQRVAEDYAPFDVDVTTQDPGLAALDRTNASDQQYGTRALITPSTSAAGAICNNQCGGVAFVGVFNHYPGAGSPPDSSTHAQYQPAWIFPHLLGPNDVKSIAEGVTHEVGHTLGLDHDGTTTQGYYAGHNGWAPIMGVAYQQPISQFSLNDYPNARLGDPGQSSLQSNPDDFVTVTNFGAGPRTDEPGTSVGSAGGVPAGSAYIHNRTDVDYFALGNCSGTVTVQANNAPVSPNLDIEAQLLTAGSTVLDTDNPASAFVSVDVASGMDATVSASSQPSGQYYVRIDGVGRGTPGNATGYTDYGSVGAYTLQVSGCAGPVVNPPSAPQNLTGSYQGGGEVQLNWSAPASNGGGAITTYNVYQDGVLIGDVAGLGAVITQVPSGVHQYGVAAVNSAGEGAVAQVTVDATDTPAQAKPGKPRIGDATRGKRGGNLTAKVRWQPPTAAANPPINGFQVIAYRKNNNGKYVKVSTSPVLGAATRSVVFTAGQRASYKFAVKARNGLGFGRRSARSNAVTPR